MMFCESMLQKGDKLTEKQKKFHDSKCVTCLQVDWLAVYVLCEMQKQVGSL